MYTDAPPSMQEGCRVCIHFYQEFTVDMSSLKPRIVHAALLLVGITVAGSLWAQSRDEIISERLQSADRVCLQGEDCSPGGSAAMEVAQSDNDGFNPESTYESSCAVCHAAGVSGAPRPTDVDLWNTRLEEDGLDTLVENAINGVNAMPPRGMCSGCSDDEMRQLVEYLLRDVL